jgi:hypothetical protein
MRKILLVGLGGGFGTVLRFFVGEKIAILHDWPPLATLLINVSGCFLIAILNFISDPSGAIYFGPRIRLLWILRWVHDVQHIQFDFFRCDPKNELVRFLGQSATLAIALPIRRLAWIHRQ